MKIRACRFLLRSAIGRTAFGFKLLKLFVRGEKRRLIVGPETDVCIEGYPRCANTFAVLAFEEAQGKCLNIAHHMHLAGQVILSVKKGIPVIVLIRDPLDAAASLLMREPELGADTCLRLYLDFYKPLVPFLDRIVVAPFKIATTDYGAIIEDVNRQFSTAFHVYRNSESADKDIFKKISNLPAHKNELTVSIPTTEKKACKEKTLALFDVEDCKVLLQECNQIYAKVSQ